MITKSFELWSMLLPFGEKVWTLFMSRTCDLVYELMVDTGVWPVYQFTHGGPVGAFDALENTFGTGTFLSFCFVSGVTFVLVYQLIAWLIDILP